jgi:triacylglycerol lipase
VITKRDILDTYLPLLEGSYARAHGVEKPTLPGPVEIVGHIEAVAARSAKPETVDMRAAQTVANPERFGFVALDRASGGFVVSIRGTMTPEEWVKDFTAISQPFDAVPGFGFVHLGFEQMWDRVQRSVKSALSLIPNGSRVTFVGHSLGGAMAVLGAADIGVTMGQCRGLQVECFTVGSPRPGGIRFAWNFKAAVPKYVRCVNDGDKVPHVAPFFFPPVWQHPAGPLKVKGIGGSNPHSLLAYRDGIEKLQGLA